jgi:hypothetical protein
MINQISLPWVTVQIQEASEKARSYLKACINMEANDTLQTKIVGDKECI